MRMFDLRVLLRWVATIAINIQPLQGYKRVPHAVVLIPEAVGIA